MAHSSYLLGICVDGKVVALGVEEELEKALRAFRNNIACRLAAILFDGLDGGSHVLDVEIELGRSLVTDDVIDKAQSTADWEVRAWDFEGEKPMCRNTEMRWGERPVEDGLIEGGSTSNVLGGDLEPYSCTNEGGRHLFGNLVV